MTTPISLTGAAQTRIMQALPDAMQPSWLKSTWSGTYGSADLRADVGRVRVEAAIEDGLLIGESTARGKVFSGPHQVGTFTRDLSLHDEGRLEVHHSYLDLEAHAQGSGFARAFNDRAFERYAQAGVDDVTIFAALDVGGYAWARQGFELDTSGAAAGERELARAVQIRNLVAYAESDGRLTEADVTMLDPRLLGADGVVHARTLTSIQDLAALPETGRRVLLGSSWNGVREIPRQQAWWHQSSDGVRDVRDGVSYLTDPVTTRERVATAARHVESELPAPVRGDEVRAAFARRFANSANVEKVQTAIEYRREELHLGANASADLGDAQVKAEVALGKQGGLHVRQSIRGNDAAVRATLDNVWRDLGVRSVADANGKPREL